jgi:hypothetical protein
MEKLKADVDKSRAEPGKNIHHNDNSDKYVMKKFERELLQV